MALRWADLRGAQPLFDDDTLTWIQQGATDSFDPAVLLRISKATEHGLNSSRVAVGRQPPEVDSMDPLLSDSAPLSDSTIRRRIVTTVKEIMPAAMRNYRWVGNCTDEEL